MWSCNGSIRYSNYLKGNVNPDNPAEPIRDDVKLLNEIEKRFKEKNSSVVCKELKGIGTGNVLRSCRGCVEDAAEILEELIDEKIINVYKIKNIITSYNTPSLILLS